MENIGEYSFSAFISTIYDNLDLNNFANWTDNQKATICHEFFHFYQNCSTVYGQVCISKICNIVATIHNEVEENFIIPYRNKDLVISNGLFDLTYSPSQDWDNINIFLKSKIKRKENLEEMINSSEFNNLKENKIEYASLCVVMKNRERKEFIFDGLAICETMIAMIEENLFPRITNYTEKYPYCLAKKISEEIRKKIKWSNEILIYICDLCLNYYNPGVTFIKFLNSVDENLTELSFSYVTSYFYAHSFDIYLDSQDNFISYSYDEYIKYHRNKVIKDLANLITSNYYETSLTWIKEGINCISIARNTVLSLFKNSEFNFQYEINWFFNMLQLGYPIFKLCDTTKSENEFFLLGPKNISDNYGGANTRLYWYGINSFLTILGLDSFDKIICPYYGNCLNSNKEKCVLDPFHLYMNENCEFHNFMSIFNLEKKNIIASNII